MAERPPKGCTEWLGTAAVSVFLAYVAILGAAKGIGNPAELTPDEAESQLEELLDGSINEDTRPEELVRAAYFNTNPPHTLTEKGTGLIMGGISEDSVQVQEPGQNCLGDNVTYTGGGVEQDGNGITLRSVDGSGPPLHFERTGIYGSLPAADEQTAAILGSDDCSDSYVGAQAVGR